VDVAIGHLRDKYGSTGSPPAGELAAALGNIQASRPQEMLTTQDDEEPDEETSLRQRQEVEAITRLVQLEQIAKPTVRSGLATALAIMGNEQYALENRKLMMEFLCNFGIWWPEVPDLLAEERAYADGKRHGLLFRYDN